MVGWQHRDEGLTRKRHILSALERERGPDHSHIDPPLAEREHLITGLDVVQGEGDPRHGLPSLTDDPGDTSHHGRAHHRDSYETLLPRAQ